MGKSLEKFGAFFVENLRDNLIEKAEMHFDGAWKKPSDLQKKISKLSDKEKALMREFVERLTVTAMHDLLFAFQEENTRGGTIKILADGEDLAANSDGLQGEIFGNDGWIARFSKFPSTQD